MSDDELWQLLGFRIERTPEGNGLRAVALDGRWRHQLSHTELALWRLVKRLRTREAALVAALEDVGQLAASWPEGGAPADVRFAYITRRVVQVLAADPPKPTGEASVETTR